MFLQQNQYITGLFHLSPKKMKRNLPIKFLFFPLALAFINFNAFSQKWDTLATIPADFTFPGVVVLNGQIHIMGGGGSNGATALHYAYDPTADTWTQKADLPYVAQQPAAAAANGKIHFFGGGFPNSGSPVDDHVVYDPLTDSWSAAAKLSQARAIHYGVSLNDQVYSLAGQGVATLFQVYDETNNQWLNKANLPDDQFWYGAHVSTEGKIYRFCGGGYTAPRSAVHRYDSDSDSWTKLADFPLAVHGLSGATIGSIIILGGGYANFAELEEMYIYNTETFNYEAITPMPIGRVYHKIVAIDSCIYSVGGNHAIDQTVGRQLIRLCPFDKTSNLKEIENQARLSTWFENGNLHISIPPGVSGKANLNVVDLSGKIILNQGIDFMEDDQIIVDLNNCSSGSYIVRLTHGEQVLTGRFLIAN
ncbi:MAG: T9SS type A sorting domain-containing protein [Saprospiraceae bacterium]